MDCVTDWFKCELDFILSSMGRQYRRCCNGNTSKKGGKASFLQGLKLDFDHLLDFSPSADAFRELAPLFTIKSILDRRLTQPAQQVCFASFEKRSIVLKIVCSNRSKIDTLFREKNICARFRSKYSNIGLQFTNKYPRILFQQMLGKEDSNVDD